MYLLTSQLDSQRKYWEERLAKIEEIAAEDRNSADLQLAESLRKVNHESIKISSFVSQTLELYSLMKALLADIS